MKCSFTCVFMLLCAQFTIAQDPGLGPGPMVVVTSAQAPIELNENGVTRVLGTVPKGTRLWALKVQGDFARVVDPGTRETGWISTRHATASNIFGQPAAELQEGFRVRQQADGAFQKGDMVSAESLYRRALDMHTKVLGAEHPYTALGQIILGIACQQSGKYALALPLYKQALKTYEQSLGPSHGSTLGLLTRIGSLHLQQGEFAAAEPLLQRALKTNELLRGPEHIDTAESAHALGACYYNQGKLVAAESLWQRSLKIKQQILGPEDASLSATLGNLAEIRREVADFAEAEKLYQQALSIQEKVQPADAAALAHIINGLGQVYKSQENYAAAESMYLRALRLREISLGPNHPETAACLHNLGQLQRSQLNHAAAASFLERALKISEETLGADHPHTVLSLYGLAHARLDMGDMITTLPLFRRILKIQKNTLGSEHPQTAQSLKTLAISLTAVGQHEEAAQRFDQERRVTNRYVKKVLPMLSEREQHLFLGSKFRKDQAMALSFGLHHLEIPAYSNLSATWLLNGKSISQESLAQKNLLTRDVTNPKLAPIVSELFRVRSELAQLVMMSPERNGVSVRQQQIAELTATEQQLTRDL